jgi:xanthine/CO dehydrogenase XdhC/CoxF family maturation factor
VRYGAELGFEVIVVDDRRQFLTAERFPEASALVHCEPRDLGSAVELDQRAHVVLMSHNYLRDLDYLRGLLGADVAYIGALGPGARLQRLLSDLDDGAPAPSILYGPAGLDIGAEGPSEIALAIMAEIVAVRRAKSGGHLRARKGPDMLRHVR